MKDSNNGWGRREGGSAYWDEVCNCMKKEKEKREVAGARIKEEVIWVEAPCKLKKSWYRKLF